MITPTDFKPEGSASVPVNAKRRALDMKLHSSSGAHMKPRWHRTVKRLNVEHRTPNIERRILKTLRFIDFKTSKPQPATSPAGVSLFRVERLSRIEFRRVYLLLAFVANLASSLVQIFLNCQNSLFDVGRSMFDVHFLVNPTHYAWQAGFLLYLESLNSEPFNLGPATRNSHPAPRNWQRATRNP